MLIWFAHNLWAVWLIAALLLAVIEMLSLDFICLMLATAALAALATSPLTDSFILQVVVFAVVSILLLLLVRPRLVQKLHKNTPDSLTNSSALIGKTAVVQELVSVDTGLVFLDGDTWTARSETPPNVFEQGAKVRVMRIDGATAYVGL